MSEKMAEETYYGKKKQQSAKWEYKLGDPFTSACSRFRGQLKLSFDPLGHPLITACKDHCFHTSFPTSKTKQQKTMFTTGETEGLAEWIIDDTCHVFNYFDKRNLSM